MVPHADEYTVSHEHIAYFSMEVGISHKLPTYSGGLGVLAGDTLKSFADLNMPVIAVTLLHRKGYFWQKLDEQGNQIEVPVRWNVDDFMIPLPNRVTVDIEGRKVKLRAWKHIVRGISGGKVPVFFLDSDLEENSDYDRRLTDHLYGGDRAYRLAQEMILGIGGIRMLASLGYDNVKKYHMNEGHAALLTVELYKKMQMHDELKDPYDLTPIKDKCVFTTHTPVAAGHDRFDRGLFSKIVGDYVPQFILDECIEGDKINMTVLGLNSSRFINGVAKRHGEVTREMFPDFRIDSITNGVHPQSWSAPSFIKLYDKYLPGWGLDPSTFRNALSIPNEKIWDAHYKAKEELVDYINRQANAGLDIDRFTIGYARRFTAYKRPDLILYDINRLQEVADRVGDIQIVFAGKAHPQDYEGKDLLKEIIHTADEINSKNGRLKIVFLKNYGMQLAKMMVSGCDVWLNTPQKPREASGTSGMKAALNGVPHFSTCDGWWLEGHIENLTGWSIGKKPTEDDGKIQDNEAEAFELYDKLEHRIIPKFYSDRQGWTNIMKHCIAINASFFNTFRMAQQYIVNAYSK